MSHTTELGLPGKTVVLHFVRTEQCDGFDETYPGVDVIALNAAIVPSGTPKPIVEKLSADIKAVVESPEFIGKTRHLGIFPKGNAPAELDGWMRKETARRAEIAKAAKIKVD